jgi:ABC-2 type transport system ATP-binding protein
VLFDGKPITDEDIYKIGYLPEERGLYKKMKVGEQALFFARLKGLSRRDALQRLKKWFIRLGIESWWDKKVEDLSKGMAQKVQFITTVLHEPKLLIFDEPFSGFDPINANILKQEILRLRDKGATVIFSTHNMSSVEEICDHITLINKSRNILSGSVDEVRHRFGENVFEVVYSGQSATFESALQPMAEMLGTTAVADTPYTSTRIRLKDGATVRESISAANEAVELRSFKEVIPSMNDIFIRAVAGKL